MFALSRMKVQNKKDLFLINLEFIFIQNILFRKPLKIVILHYFYLMDIIILYFF